MEKKKVVNIEEVTEIFCDLCGKKVSDGLHDGMGGTNFFGAWVELFHPPNEFTVKVKEGTRTDTMIFEIHVANSIPVYGKPERWVVCIKCSEKIKGFMESLKDASPS